MKGCLQCLIIVCVALRGKWLVISCCHCELRSFWMCTRGWKKCTHEIFKFMLKTPSTQGNFFSQSRIFSTTFFRFSFWLQTQFFFLEEGCSLYLSSGQIISFLFMLDFILMFEHSSSTTATQKTTWKVFFYRLLYLTLLFMMCICGEILLSKTLFEKSFFICKHILTRKLTHQMKT